MQLIAGRTAQERAAAHSKEDDYDVNTIEADEHLHRWLLYIDLNMLRAGVVNHVRSERRAVFVRCQ
jgi:putative transposase